MNYIDWDSLKEGDRVVVPAAVANWVYNKDPTRWRVTKYKDNTAAVVCTAPNQGKTHGKNQQVD